jgi:hypothetical protein
MQLHLLHHQHLQLSRQLAEFARVKNVEKFTGWNNEISGARSASGKKLVLDLAPTPLEMPQPLLVQLAPLQLRLEPYKTF